MRETNLVIVGVGGQGVLSASRLLAQAAVDAGERVLVGDTFGASQREGSVMTHVRIGATVRGAMVSPGIADILLAFEPYEALRRLHYLREGGAIVVNTAPIVPARQALEGGYPLIDDVWKALAARGSGILRLSASAEAARLAAQHGSRYDVTNVVILGAAATLSACPVDVARLEATIRARFRQASLPLNLEALERGKALARMAAWTHPPERAKGGTPWTQERIRSVEAGK